LSTKQEVLKRRTLISDYLAKSVTKPSELSKQTGIPVKTVKNDLDHMRKNSIKWLHKHTLDGYVHATQQTIDQLQDIESELQEMRNKLAKDDEGAVLKRKAILVALVDVINIRWMIQGDGPTYLSNKYTNNNAHK